MTSSGIENEIENSRGSIRKRVSLQRHDRRAREDTSPPTQHGAIGGPPFDILLNGYDGRWRSEHRERRPDIPFEQQLPADIDLCASPQATEGFYRSVLG